MKPEASSEYIEELARVISADPDVREATNRFLERRRPPTILWLLDHFKRPPPLDPGLTTPTDRTLTPTMKRILSKG